MSHITYTYDIYISKYISHITVITGHTHTHTWRNYANHTLFSGGLANTYLCISQIPEFSWMSHNTYIHYSQER